MKTALLLIAFVTVASFGYAQKKEKDTSGLKTIKRSEQPSKSEETSEEKPLRKIASGRGEEEIEQEIEETMEGLDEEIEREIERSMEGLDEQIEREVERSMEGLDEEIERQVEASLEGLDEQIEMSLEGLDEQIEASLEESLEALEHLDIDINIDGRHIDVHEIVEEALRDAKTEIKETRKVKSKPRE